MERKGKGGLRRREGGKGWRNERKEKRIGGRGKVGDEKDEGGYETERVGRR